MFAVKSPDGIALWRRLFNAVSDYPIGTVVTYAELEHIMGYDIQEQRSAIYETNKQLLDDKDRMLVNVRSIGYKMATPKEQLGQAQGRPLRAKRQLKKGIHEANNIDHKGLSPEEKKYRMDLMNKLQVSLSILNKRHVSAIDQQKKAIVEQKKAVQNQKGTQDTISDIERQLNELRASLEIES